MKTTILLCFLVALGAAKQQNHDGAWQQQTEYRYKVRTQSLAAIPNLKNQWVGTFTKADLIIHPKSENVLIGKLQNGQQSEWHDALADGPTTYVPDNQLSYQPMEINTKPFEIRLNQGAIHSIAVDKDMTNVELNQLKAILSQFQIDLKARNLMDSPRGHLPQNNDNEDNRSQALYKVMEPTVTGKTETFYDVSRVPLYIAQAYPEYDSQVQLKEGEHFYEVYKTKNYTNSEQRMGYHFGVHGMNDWKPNTNLMGSLTKSAISRIIISGSFDKFTVRSSVTTNRVVKANPDKDAQHDSVVVSQVNVTLVSMEETQSKPQLGNEQLVDVGNLVYSYDVPSDAKNSLRPKQDSSESNENDYDDDNQWLETAVGKMYNQQQEASNNNGNNNNNQQYKSRNPRSIQSRKNSYNNYNNNFNDNRNNEQTYFQKQEYHQSKPSMKYAPEHPLLSYFVGNKGRSIQSRKEFNAPAEVQKLTEEIGQDLENVAQVPVKQTLRKFNVLAKIIRTMNAEQIEETTRYFAEQNQQTTEKTRQVYRDALLTAGTGPAINELMGWIEEGKLKGEEAAEVIASFSKTIREPTAEMQQRFFDFVQNDAVKRQSNVNTTAGISFTRFLHRAQVNQKSAAKYYPVDSYGRFSNDRENKFVSERVVPYFAQLLQNYLKQQDAPNTLYAIRALGNIGHAQVAKVFEKYLNGEERVTDFQRLAMVLALDKFAANYQKEAQVILYHLYQNKGETNEIRSTAVFQMIRNNPIPAVLQRLAEETNNENSPYVRASVRSALESAARLTNPENAELARNAKAALNLLKPETQGVQYSRTHLRDYAINQIEAAYEQQASYIVNGDSFIPNGVFVDTIGKLGGFTRRAEYQAVINSVEELLNAFTDNVNSWSRKNNQNGNQNGNDYDNEYANEYENQQQQQQQQQQSTWSAKKIIDLLNIKPNKASKQQLEGQILLDILGSERFFAFDKQSFEQTPQQMKKIANQLRNGLNVQYTKLYNQDDVTISFPLETGIPFTFTQRTPTLVQVNGQIRARSNQQTAENTENQVPESVNVTAEIDAVYSTQNEVIVSFINPSTSQRYTAGYDKKVQVNVPVHVTADIDIRNREIKTEVKPLNTEKTTKFLQMGSWPFTARDNIFKFRPLTESEHTKEIRSQPTREQEFVVGEKQTGYAFVVKGAQNKDSNQMMNIFKQLSKHDMTSFLLFGQQNTSPEHYTLTVALDAKRSSTKSTKFTVKYDRETINGQNQNNYEHVKHPRARGQSADGTTNLAIPVSDESNSQPRREQFTRNAAEGMTSADANVVDVSVQFVGAQKKREYVATYAYATSKTQGKSRVLVFAQKSATEAPSKAVYLQLDAKYQTADELRQQQQQEQQQQQQQNQQPFADVKFKLSYSLDNVLELATVNGKLNLKQTAKVQKYMQNLYKVKSSIETPFVYANTADHVDIELDYQNAPLEVLQKAFGVKFANVYNYIRYATQMNLNENTEYQGENGKVHFQFRFNPDMKSVNVTLKAPTVKAEWNGIRVPSMTKNVVVVPTNWNMLEEIKREFIQNRDTCLISGQETSTFENRTVKQGALGNTWHLAVHKMREGVYAQNQNQNENNNNNNKRVHYVSALVRDAQQSNQEQQQQTYQYNDNESQWNRDAKKNKEVLIVLHQQNQNDMTVQLKPSTNEHKSTPRVFVNGKEQDLSQSQTTVVRSSENPKDILARVYVTEQKQGQQQQQQSVRVEATHGNLEVTYDGKNVQFRSTGFIRNNRGICGSFNGQKVTELKSPENKIINNDKEFAASWAVVEENSNADNIVQQLKQRIQQKHYPTEKVLYSNPVPKIEKSQRPSNDNNEQQNQQSPKAQNWEEERKQTLNLNKPAQSASKHQTQFIEDADNQRICFSKRPLPVCTPGNRVSGKIVKDVEVVCRNINDAAAQQYKSQIQRGRNVDMSNYDTSDSMKFVIPKRCEREI